MLVSDIAPAQGRLLVSLGLVQGYTARWRRLRAVSPSPNSRGLTGRLNDTVGVTACLRLIFRMWLKFAVGSFSSVLSRQKGPFQCCLCICVCAVCVFAHVQFWRDAQEKNRFMVIIRAVVESHTPRDDELCMGLSPVCTPPVYCMPYIYTHCLLAGRHWRVETAQIGFCLWVSVSLNQVAFV